MDPSKINKATMLHYLLEDDVDEVTYPKDTLYIQDGNAHALTNLYQTFREICLGLLDQMMAK